MSDEMDPNSCKWTLLGVFCVINTVRYKHFHNKWGFRGDQKIWYFFRFFNDRNIGLADVIVFRQKWIKITKYTLKGLNYVLQPLFWGKIGYEQSCRGVLKKFEFFFIAFSQSGRLISVSARRNGPKFMLTDTYRCLLRYEHVWTGMNT